MCRLDFLLVLACFLCFSRSVYGSENVTLDEVPVETLVNLTGNNELWAILLKDCREPSLTCVQNNIYKFLRDTLDKTEDLQFTSFLKFTKNKLDYAKIKRSYDTDTNFTDDTDIYEDEYPIESMSRSLHDNTAGFFMTHDLELSLPDGLFPNSFLKISPKGFQEQGALVNLEVVSKDVPKDTGLKEEGRTIKKIQKFISEKLIYALLAILLIIKLLAVKFLFLFPLIVGAATAKKLLLKVLLFVFPFLHHIFKFCAYYPIQAKYHHHKHLISHIHEVAPTKHHHDHHDGIEVIGPHPYDHPPVEYHGPHDVHHAEFDDDVSVLPDDGSGFPHGLISHRRDPTRDDNEISPYGKVQATRRKPNRPLNSIEIERMVAKAEKEAFIKARLEKERLRIREDNLRLQDQLNQAIKQQEKLKQQAVFYSKKLPHTKISASVPYGNKPIGIGPPPPRGLQIDPSSVQRPIISDGPGIDLPAGYIPQHVVPQQTPINHPFQSNYDQQYQSSLVNDQREPSKSSLNIQREPSQSNVNTQHEPSQSNFNRGPVYKPPISNPQAVTQEVNRRQPVSSAEYDFRQSVEYDPRNPAHTDSSEEVQYNKNMGNADQKFVVESNKRQVPEKPTAAPKNKLDQDIYQASSITNDPFYTPILEKIDKILQGLGFNDESCKERLICSMYKNPTSFSPHSNLLSLELSRDSSELQKPTSTNSAVIRFYKYVQAARDGQDQRDCLRLYPTCGINTEVS